MFAPTGFTHLWETVREVIWVVCGVCERRLKRLREPAA